MDKKTNDWNGFEKIDVSQLSDDLFKINNDWALVTAGVDSSYNTMTISWGGFGTIWNKPVAFVFVRDNRYTFEFMEREGLFTLEFFNPEHRKAMEICGTKSGRYVDKVAEAGLTPTATPSGSMAFEEGNMIVECRKIYSQMLDEKQLKSVDVVKFYNTDTGLHKMFIGEIVGVWKKKI